MPPSPPLPLVALNPYVLVGNRAAGVRIPASRDSPSFILLPRDLRIYATVDAPPKLIQKYVDGFCSLFPTAEIVFVKSFSSFFFTRRGYCEKMLLPVVEILHAHVEGRKTSAGILVHVFSNGGGFNYMLFHALLCRPSAQHLTLAFHPPRR
ncbi:hypothetical protein HMN09_00659800 [Mycena chlorophos]|uniref:Uncharacterized protein n=1 Tax=Mycena chlorophos TaxID=658473 RepID=A0A8H6SZF0_MYCCL|nr:hypothetical protein HMN09_00659800 [Mycena chlorophos]